MNSKTVIKYGGSNLKEPGSINRLKEIISNYDVAPVIVVSAFFGVTDLLVRKLPEIINNKCAITDILEHLRKENLKQLESQINSSEKQNAIIDLAEERLKELENYLNGIFLIGELPAFLEDTVVSFGEKMSSLIITGILKASEIDCEEILPENIPLITNGEFGHAQVDISKSKWKVYAKLSDQKVLIVPGFYGVSEAGKITLLGRGGSDYSAACIAACIGAKSLDIWKDVEGYLSADPRFVENTSNIEQLTYDEAAELSYFGSKILHPQTVDPLRQEKIPINIFNIKKEIKNARPLTVIDESGSQGEQVIKSISFRDDLSILRIKGAGIGSQPGILSKLSGKLNDFGININSVITSQITINFLLESKNIDVAHDIIEAMKINVIKEINKIDNISVIAVVGRGMLEQFGIASRIFQSLAKNEINVKLSSMGASEFVTYLAVDKENRSKAINLIHDEFFTNN